MLFLARQGGGAMSSYADRITQPTVVEVPRSGAASPTAP
jgi:hypothetical protein